MTGPDAARPMVAVVDLWKHRGGVAVLKGVSLTVKRGQVLCLLGPSGAGKSTLLRCVNGLEQPDSGLVFVDGDPIGCRERDGRYHQLSERESARQRAAIGMVFQSFNLFPHMTVLRNVTDAPIRIHGETRAAAEAQARALLAQVGLGDKAAAYPRQLSGGQQQRVAIARALAMRPKLMLFDEATSALDPRSAGEVLAIMRDLAQTGVTMVVVTHAIDFARAAADQVAILDDGVIIESGPPGQVLADPAHAQTRAFLAGVL
ncbi:MAG: amino acid ABC transporter ATP-binding protein [Acetobacteraceae bacterium]